MVRENHPNKCPHICLYLTVKQQTCRSGRHLAGGVTPAKAAHYTYRLKPCKPFLKKSFEARSGSRNGVETAARGGDLNNSPSQPQGNEFGIFGHLATSPPPAFPPSARSHLGAAESPYQERRKDHAICQRFTYIGACQPKQMQPGQNRRGINQTV